MKNKVSDYRKKFHLSQAALAKRIGVSRQTIISIENGRYNPSLPLALILAETFDTSVEQLFILEEKDYENYKGR